MDAPRNVGSGPAKGGFRKCGARQVRPMLTASANAQASMKGVQTKNFRRVSTEADLRADLGVVQPARPFTYASGPGEHPSR